MPDRYIDVFEVSEYGDFLHKQLEGVEGASPLVDVAALRGQLSEAVRRVEAERQSAGLQRSEARQGRQEALGTAEALRGMLGRLMSFLDSVDPEEGSLDRRAFLPTGQGGGVSLLKPADLKARAALALEALGLPGHQGIPGVPAWREKIQRGYDALSQELAARDSRRGSGLVMTAKLSSAREEFLHLYNRVAKPLVRGLLHALRRGEEFERFFRDLQVNEGGASLADYVPEETAPEPVASDKPAE